MTSDLEEMIRRRAHAIWEQEGRPDGRHEEHWQIAAGEITRELEEIKATHTPAMAEEIEAPAAPRRGRPRRAKVDDHGDDASQPRARRTSKVASSASASGGEVSEGRSEGDPQAPRKRGRKPTGDTPPDVAAAGTTTTRRRGANAVTSAQSEPVAGADPSPRTRRKKSEAAEAGSDAGAEEHSSRRGRKPKADSGTI